MADVIKNVDAGLEPALKFVAQLATEAADAKGLVDVVPLVGDPIGRYLVVNADGNVEYGEPAPVPRDTVLVGVSEIAPYVDFISNDQVRPSVYYDADEVVIVCNDSHGSRRQDRARVVMEYTPQFATLVELDKGAKQFKQREFIRLFNRDLRECIAPDDLKALLRSLRALEWESSVKGADVVERGRESMGREIKQELQSKAGPIPEEITLTCSVFTDRGVSSMAIVKCLIEIDPRAQCFTLEPLTGQVDAEIATAVESLGSVLRAQIKESAPVFCGSP